MHNQLHLIKVELTNQELKLFKDSEKNPKEWNRLKSDKFELISSLIQGGDK